MLVLFLIQPGQAFHRPLPRSFLSMQRLSLAAADEPTSAPTTTTTTTTTTAGEVDDADDFDQTPDQVRRTRLGRSRDQDGKSNIWSVEPKMEVVSELGENDFKKNLIIGGLVIGTAIISLPLIQALGGLFPDPSDF
eukprot:gene4145-4549_t